MLARVSSLESFRQWRGDEEQTASDLVEWLTTDNPSEAMLAGTALHKALENAEEGDHETLEANGYTFHMPDATLALPSVREVRGYSGYGGLVVTGQVDAVDGKRIDDHKSTGSFAPDRYLSGYSWRLYLEMFGCHVFRWNVFEIKPDPKLAKVYTVKPPHILEAYSYPGMREDCADLARDFQEFATNHLPLGWGPAGLKHPGALLEQYK